MTDPWPPTTLVELNRAIENGLLGESHFVDIKRELPPPPKNDRIAADLAAFSVDGGVIFVGVDEAGGTVQVSASPLAGLAERVEQIGLASVDPPVRVTTFTVETEPGHGVLVIVVPPSPNAPHMVDGRYRGRGDRTNLVLTDADVVRIRGDVQGHLDDAVDLLREWLPNAMRGKRDTGPLLAMLARPSVVRQEMVLREWLPDPREWIQDKLLRGPLTTRLAERYSPDFYDSLTIAPRANGWGISHAGEDWSELDLEIHEDGTLRLRAGDLESAGRDRRYVNDVAINGLVRRLILTAGALGRECSYVGSWDFALVVAPLRGKASLSVLSMGLIRSHLPPYSEDGYEENCSASMQEIDADTDGVHRRLLGRLNRAFGGTNPLVLK